RIGTAPGGGARAGGAVGRRAEIEGQEPARGRLAGEIRAGERARHRGHQLYSGAGAVLLPVGGTIDGNELTETTHRRSCSRLCSPEPAPPRCSPLPFF